MKPVLVVIDVQKGMDEIEATGRRRNNPQALARIVELLAAFRAAAFPIIHVRHHSTEAESVFRPDRPGVAVLNEARERGDEPVLIKHVNSAFIGTDLEARLIALGRPPLVLCGATTNHCVETTTRMAANLGFEATLIRDATWAFDAVGPDRDVHPAEAVHAMTLANIANEFGRVATTQTIIAGLNGQGQQD